MSFKYYNEIVGDKLFFTVHKVHYCININELLSISFTKRDKKSHWEGLGFGTLITFKDEFDEIFIPHKGGDGGSGDVVGFAEEEHNKIVLGLLETCKQNIKPS